jgi:S-adenosylmethionine:tRNA ribosyltransferase-isomerase
MQLTDFDYHLPQHFIAQTPADPRDSSKLMTLDQHTGAVGHHIFRDLPQHLQPGDVLVLNDTRVIPARIPAQKTNTGGKAEILLLHQVDDTHWRCLVGGKNIDQTTPLTIPGTAITAHIEANYQHSERLVRFSQPINTILPNIGNLPLPPYIHQQVKDEERYQTIYSRREGSAAAPTAGLHFTADVFEAVKAKGVKLAYCTLHIGLDTFQPVKVDNIKNHHIHSEYATLSATDAQIINQAKLAGGRIIAVGTTSARTLETAGILSAGGDPAHPQQTDGMCAWRPVIAFEDETRLFIYPGYQWRVLDGLITNFHLPKSTLLMMISALAGRENVLAAYEQAKTNNYRFFSFGDAMFIR